MPRILSVSRNPQLLATRNDALALAGYTVSSPKSPSETLLLLAQDTFDAVIIGHSVEAEARAPLIRAIRNLRPGLPVVFAYTAAESGEEPLADANVEFSHGPTALIQKLDKLLRGPGRLGSATA